MTNGIPTAQPSTSSPRTTHRTEALRAPNSLAHPVMTVLLLIVAAASVRFGMELLLLAKKGEMRDFAAYYTAAVMARSGAIFYDPQPGKPWFFENENPELIATASRLGTLHRHETVEHVHIFSYPPAMMFLFLPLAFFSLPVAKLVWLGFSLLALGGGMWLIAQTISSRPLTILFMVFLALTFHPVRNTLNLGQVNAVMLMLLAAFFACYRRRHDTAAGVVLGLAAAVRFHPVFLILYLLWRREFRPATVALATAGAVSGLAVVAFGTDQSAIYFSQVAPKFLSALISVENHSLAGFLATVGQSLGWTAPDVQTGSPWTARIAAGLMVAFSALLLSRPAAPRGSRSADLEFALLLVMLPLATPNATINHLVTILPSVWILFEHLLDGGSPRQVLRSCLAGAAVIMIGVVDDFYLHPTLAHGVWILAAEIKFYGLVLLFVSIGWLLRDDRPETAVAPAPATWS